MYQKYAKLRDDKGVTDYEVAKQTGIATATLTSWKQGAYTPKVEKLMLIAQYFGVPLEYFYTGDE